MPPTVLCLRSVPSSAPRPHLHETDHRRPQSPAATAPWSRAAHGFTTLPLAPSTTSPYLPLQVEANPFSSSSRSPPLALLFNGHHSYRRTPPSTACYAALLSALQDHVGSPSTAPTPSHRPACSRRRALMPVPPATSCMATLSMTTSSSHRLGPPRHRRISHHRHAPPRILSRPPQPPNDPLTGAPPHSKCATVQPPMW
jgi:hypothetical protein